MISRPAVTVVMPVHNVENYIAPAIISILNQTFRDFELWVLENGSTDRTAEIAERFRDPRVRVFKLGAIGFQGALSFALEHAKSGWIARMDGDDICFPTRLEAQMKVVRESPDYVLVGTSYAILTPFGHIIERRRNVPSRELDKFAVALGGYRIDQPKGRICADAAMLFNRKVALDAGGYDSDFRMGDVPLWLRMLEGRKGWEIAESHYVYRLLPRSFSKSHNEGIEVRVKYSPELLEDFLSFCYGPKSANRTDGNGKKNGRSEAEFWRHIAFLEFLAGDYVANMQIAKRLEESGEFKPARRLKLRAYSGKIGSLFYNWKWRSHYRHRPDWERQLGSLL